MLAGRIWMMRAGDGRFSLPPSARFRPQPLSNLSKTRRIRNQHLGNKKSSQPRARRSGKTDRDASRRAVRVRGRIVLRDVRRDLAGIGPAMIEAAVRRAKAGPVKRLAETGLPAHLEEAHRT